MGARAALLQKVKGYERRRVVLVGVLVFAVVGTALLIMSLAATNLSIEAEDSTRSGKASVVSDAGASGGKALHFGSTVVSGIAPTNLRAFVGGDSIALRWKAVDQQLAPVKYHVFRDGTEVSAITVASAPVHMYESPGTLYIDTNVAAGQEYKYKVQAELQDGGLSALSAEVSAVHTSEVATPTISHVANGVAGMDSYFAIADDTIKTWYPKMANLLTKGGQFSVPRTVIVNIVPGSACGVADTESDGESAKLNICEQYARDHPEDIAMIIHEFTHGIQSFNGEPTSKMLQEGTASWASDQAMGHEQSPPADTETFDDGYSPASYFFSWIAEKYNKPDLVPDMFVARRNQSIDGVTVIKQQTGKDVGQLWTEMTGRTVSSLGRLENGGGMCVDIYGADTKGAAKVGPCHPTIYEAIVYIQDPTNSAQGLLKNSTIYKCLTVIGNAVGVGDCSFSNSNALWKVANNSVSLANGGTCLDSENGGLVDSLLIIASCNGSTSQTWSINTNW